MTEELQTIIVGITGGIGAGKSGVAAIFREYGITVFDADAIAAQIIAENKPVRTELQQLLGGGAFRSDGTVDSVVVSRLVFGNTPDHSRRLKELNRIVHPHVLDELCERIEVARDAGVKVVAVDIALLFEVGLEDAFDYIVLVLAPEAERVKRVMRRSGLTAEQVRLRMNAQDPDDHKKPMADFVIENDSTPENLRKAATFLAELFPMLPPKPDEESGDDDFDDDEEA